MSEYKEFVKDFAFRTKKNLKYIESKKNIGCDSVFEFTQLVNSLLGLLVIPQERECDRICNNFVSQKTCEGLKACIERNDYNNECDFTNILRHMRNAIAHGQVEIGATNGEISSILFIDKNHNNCRQFHIRLTCSQLRDFIEEFSDSLIEKL